MKKLIILLLTLVLSMCAFGLVACGGTEEPGGQGGGETPGYSVTGTEGLSYLKTKNSTTNEEYAIFTGLKRDCTATEITIASHYEGLPVLEVGLAPLTNFSKVEKVNIHKLVKVIGDSAFYGAKALKEVNFDNDCELDRIGAYAFKDCAKLESISLPSTIKSVSAGVFDGCTLLKYNEYEGASYLGSSSKPYMILMKGNETATSCKVNKDCLIINSSAFENYALLRTITFEENSALLNISSMAFKKSGIEEISIPASVQSIGVETFMECPNLVTVNFADNTAVTQMGERAFHLCPKLQKVNNFEKCRITECNTGLFYKSKALQSITIPNTVTLMKSGCLEDCSGLKSLTFQAGSQLQRTEPGVFSGCIGLRQVILPKSHTSCEWNTFYWCNKQLKIYLERSSIPAGYNSQINKSCYYDSVTKKTVTFDLELYLYSETAPTEEGNFWRYVDGEPVIW